MDSQCGKLVTVIITVYHTDRRHLCTAWWREALRRTGLSAAAETCVWHCPAMDSVSSSEKTDL